MLTCTKRHDHHKAALVFCQSMHNHPKCQFWPCTACQQGNIGNKKDRQQAPALHVHDVRQTCGRTKGAYVGKSSITCNRAGIKHNANASAMNKAQGPPAAELFSKGGMPTAHSRSAAGPSHEPSSPPAQQSPLLV